MTFIGALAGMPAASLVTPADVIKTRLQVQIPAVKVKVKTIIFINVPLSSCVSCQCCGVGTWVLYIGRTVLNS